MARLPPQDAIRDALEIMRLSGMPLTSTRDDDGEQKVIKAFACRPYMTQLSLLSSNIGDKGAEALATILDEENMLRSISLQFNRIGPRGAKRLATTLENNDKLEILNLHDNMLGVDGAKSLASMLHHNHSLRNISICGNDIGPEGAKAFAKVLRTNHIIEELNLAGNNIGDQGALALADAIKVNTTLRTLKIGSNNIGFRGIQALAAALALNKTLKRLDFLGNRLSPESAAVLAESLAVNTTLIELTFANHFGSLQVISELTPQSMEFQLGRVEQEVQLNSTLECLRAELAQSRQTLDELQCSYAISQKFGLPLRRIRKRQRSSSAHSQQWQHIVEDHPKKREVQALEREKLAIDEQVQILSLRLTPFLSLSLQS